MLFPQYGTRVPVRTVLRIRTHLCAVDLRNKHVTTTIVTSYHSCHGPGSCSTLQIKRKTLQVDAFV